MDRSSPGLKRLRTTPDRIGSQSMRERLHLRGGLVLLMTMAVAAGSRGDDEPEKATAPASEANPAVPAPGHSIHGEAFNEGPRQKAHLMPGMGKVSFPVSVSRKEAQEFIDQGVAQLHTFYYLEAERSFRQAALIDPACAMAYWGMAMANVNNDKRARGFLKLAQEKAKDRPVTRREQLYLDALAGLYREKVSDKDRRKAHLQGLEAIVQEFPADLDAKAWLAMVTWQNSSKGDGIGSHQAVDALLESVLAVEPMHPGAHHYRIHLWDGVKPIRAELSAGLYAKAAPGIAHAWHMPGHTYTGLKRYADAAYQQEGSARVDHAAMLRERTMPFEIHNYAHNNQWLATSLSHVGRVHDAVAIARDLVEQPRDPQKNHKNDGGSAQRSGRMRWMEVLTRYEKWDDLIQATESGALDWSDLPIEQKEKARSLGLAYAGKGDRAKLAEQIAALKAMIVEEPKEEAKPGQGDKPGEDKPKEGESKKPRTVPGAPAALAELEGHERLLEGDFDAAFARFEKATGMRKEALARAYLAAKRFDKAEETVRKAVEDQPNEVAPLAAQVEILQAIGKVADAQEAYRKLEPLARSADADLPVFQRLSGIVASWRSAGQALPAPGSAPSESAALNRADLATVGPLTWSPYPAEPIALTDTEGQHWTLAEKLHKGRNTVVLFYLGGQCAHCMQQLQAFGEQFEALREAGTDVVAISTDDAEATRALKRNDDGVKFPMPLLADPELATFRAYRAFDDFENQPLHGTFLIDAQGGVRFHRISSDPFLDVAFLKAESARVQKLVP
jgi:peroxiredoxin